jgi:hypothetical protein
MAYRLDLSSPVEAAEQFCVQAASELGITEATVGVCVREVAQYVDKTVAGILESRAITVRFYFLMLP